jgi:serine/threonine protein phosphatase PrpC
MPIFRDARSPSHSKQEGKGERFVPRTADIVSRKPALLSEMLPGVADSATTIGGKGLQQDACYHVSLPGAKIVAVADGISSAYRADYAAQLALLSALGHFQYRILDDHPVDERLLLAAFDQAHRHVRRLNAALNGPTGRGAATTMIVAVETQDTFYFGSLGDGAALFSYAEMDWVTNCLYPQQDRGALTQYLGTSADRVRPSISIMPKSEYSGGVAVIMTDGMYRKETIMRDAVRSLRGIRDRVTAVSRENVIDIHQYLEEWVTGVETDDNRSVGVLISQEAIDYWRRKHDPFGG